MTTKRIIHFRIPLALPFSQYIPPLAALFGFKIDVPHGSDVEIGVYEVEGVGRHEIDFIKPFDYLPATHVTAIGYLKFCIPLTDKCIYIPMPVFVYKVDTSRIYLLSFASKAIVSFTAHAPRREAVGQGTIMAR